MTLSDPQPGFQGHCILTSRISQKRCILGTRLLKNTNRKPYTIYRMIPLSMTLSDLWPRFQGHNFLWSRMSEKRHVLKTKLLLHKRKVSNIWNGTMFGDLDCKVTNCNICKWPQSHSGSKRLQTDHWINMNGAVLPLLEVYPPLSAIPVHSKCIAQVYQHQLSFFNYWIMKWVNHHPRI